MVHGKNFAAFPSALGPRAFFSPGCICVKSLNVTDPQLECSTLCLWATGLLVGQHREGVFAPRTGVRSAQGAWGRRQGTRGGISVTPGRRPCPSRVSWNGGPSPPCFPPRWPFRGAERLGGSAGGRQLHYPCSVAPDAGVPSPGPVLEASGAERKACFHCPGRERSPSWGSHVL